VQTTNKVWDLLIFIDDYWFPCFPTGLEKLPFPTILYSSDFQTAPNWYMPMIYLFDFVFLTNYDPIKEISILNKNVYWAPPGFDSFTFKSLKLDRTYDVGIVGGTHSAFPDRIKRLKILEKKYKTNYFWKNYSRKEINNIYNKSKVVVNFVPKGIKTFQFRILEGMACGALMICEGSDSGVRKLFRENEEIIFFKTDSELYNLIDFYLDNNQERENIAKNGQQKVWLNHKWVDRIHELLKNIGSIKNQLCAPARNSSSMEIKKLYLKIYGRRGLIDPILDLYSKNNKKVPFFLFYEQIFLAFLRKAGMLKNLRRLYKKFFLVGFN
jgi:hypothetical protein